MIAVEVQGEWYGASLGFKDLTKRMKDARKPLKEGIHKYMTTSVLERFKRQGIPRWKSRFVPVAWPMLNKTGTLMRSVTNPMSTNKTISYPSRKEVTLQSKVPYAPYHDKERAYTDPNSSIYGRPFLEVTNKDADMFLDILADWATVNAQQSFGNK